MPPRKRKQQSKAVTENRVPSFADDEKADYFADVDAEADEDTKGPDCPLFSIELDKQVARKRQIEELKEKYKIGQTIQAKDIGRDEWYDAKVVEYDDLDQEILIHYPNWSQRFDEWIALDSARLRPKEEPTKTKRPTKVFTAGEWVMATWTGSRKYPAEIKSVLGDDKYEVEFYDGYIKTINASRINKFENADENAQQLPVTDAAAASTSTSTSQLPGLNTSGFNLEPKYSKEERRLRMRKLNIAELFHTNRRRRRRKGGNSDDSESGSEVEGKRPPKISKRKCARSLVRDSENSGTGRSKSTWQSRLLGNDSDTCDRVESKGRTKRKSSRIGGSDENRARTRRTSLSLFGGSDIETKSLIRRMSSSSLGGSDTEKRTRTRRMSSSPLQGSDIETKIRRRRTSSTRLVASDTETRRVTRRMSWGSDIETETRTRRMSPSPIRGSEFEYQLRRRTSLSPLVSSDIETRTRRRRTTSTNALSESDIETRSRTGRNRSRTPTSYGGSDIARARSVSRVRSEVSDSDIEQSKNYRKCVSEGEMDSIGGPVAPKRRKRRRRKPWGPIRKKKTPSFTDLSSYSGHSAAESETGSILQFKGWTTTTEEKHSVTIKKLSEELFNELTIVRISTEKLPVGWSKYAVAKKPGDKDKKWKVYYTSPDGQKLQKKAELKNYMSRFPVAQFDFSFKLKDWTELVDELNIQLANQPNVRPTLSGTQETASTEKAAPKTLKTLLPKKRTKEESMPSPVIKQKNRKGEAAEQIVNGTLVIGQLKILIKDSQYICPEMKCPKIYRTKRTLMLHLRRIHPDSFKLTEEQTTDGSARDESGGSTQSQETSSNAAAVSNDKLNSKEVRKETAEIKAIGSRNFGFVKRFSTIVEEEESELMELDKNDDEENTKEGKEDQTGQQEEVKENETGQQKEGKGYQAGQQEEGKENQAGQQEEGKENQAGQQEEGKENQAGKQEEGNENQAGQQEEGKENQAGQQEEGIENQPGQQEEGKENQAGQQEEGKENQAGKQEEGNENQAGQQEEGKENQAGQQEEGKENQTGQQEEGKENQTGQQEEGKENQTGQQEEGKEFVEQEQTHLPVEEPSPLSLQDPAQLLQDPTELPLPDPNRQQEASQQKEVLQELAEKAELEADQKSGLAKDSSQEVQMELYQDVESGKEREIDPEHESESGAESEHNSLQPCELETGEKRGNEQRCETEAGWEPELEDAHESEPEPVSETELELDPTDCTDSGTTVNDDFSGSAQGDSSQDGAGTDSPTSQALLPVIRLQKLEEDRHLGNLPIVQKVLLEQQRQRIEAEEDTGDQTACELENRVQHAHLKRLLGRRSAYVKRRRPGIKYMKKPSLEECTGPGSVESEDSLEPHPEPVHEHQRSSLVHLEKVKSSLDSNESELDERSQMSSTSDTQHSKNSSERGDIINCSCHINEEHGLMVQCDMCCCWQHGACNNIQEEGDVPEKYVCTFCLNPPRERPAKKYSHSQDWLLTGKLARLSVAATSEEEKEEYAEALKLSHDILSCLINVKKAMWAIRVKVETITRQDHPKLYQWNEKWDSYTEAVTDDDDGNEKRDDSPVNEDANAINGRTVQSVKEEFVANEDTKTDLVKEGENKGNDEVPVTDIFGAISSSSSTDSMNGCQPVLEMLIDVRTEDRCVLHETPIIEEPGSATVFAVPVPEDENTEQDSVSTDEASFLTADSSFRIHEFSFMTPDASICEDAKSPVEMEYDIIDEDITMLIHSMGDIFTKEGKEDEEEEEQEKEEEEADPLSIDEECESVVLKRLCETFGDDKSLLEIYQSAEEHKTYGEESSLSDDVNTVDESETHDERFCSLINETEGENNTRVINTGSDDSLQETEVKYSSHDKDLGMGYHKMGTSVQSGVDECITARQELSSEQGLRVRTIKMDPKITVQLVENVPVISMETDKNKSILMLEAGNDKPTLQKKRNDLDVPLQSDSDESDVFFSPIPAVKGKHHETVQPERNEENILFHSSKSENNVTAKEIKDQPFSSKLFCSTPVNINYGFIPQEITGSTKSVNIEISQIKHETTTPIVNNRNDRIVDTCKDNVQCENSSSGEYYDTMGRSTNKGSESQCDEYDSITSVSTNLSAQTVGANENGDKSEKATPESFERILNEFKTGSKSVSYQGNLSSDPEFQSEVAKLEETVESMESDSCGPSRLERVRNTTNPLEPLPISIFPRGNDYGTVQYDAFMDNANDAVVPNILNQSNEQQISRINSVNIDGAPVIFEDLLLQEEIVYDREISSSEAPEFQLPINAAQILQFADSMEESLCSSDSEHHRRVPATGPQPEALIETEVCRGNLAYHLAVQHKKLKEILDAAEKQLKDLELKIMDDSERMRPADITRRLKKIIKILNLANNLGKQDNVQAAKSVSNSK